MSLLKLMQAFEVAVSDRTIERLKMHQDSLLVQTASYYEAYRLSELASVAAALKSLTPSFHEKDPLVKALRKPLTELKPLAEAVVAAQKALNERDHEPRRAGMGGDVELREKTPAEQVLALRQASLDAARARLSAAVATAAAVHPVLYRFNVPELIEAEAADAKALGKQAFTRLQKSWQAGEAIKYKLGQVRPASGVQIKDISAGTVPEDLVAKDAKGSMWAYRKLTDAGLAACDPQAGAFLKRAVANVDVARSREAGKKRDTETNETVGIVALTVALHAVCPPLALALDLASSVRDVYRVAVDTSLSSAEAWCFLSPGDCLTDDPPSSWPLVLALAGAIMTVVV